MFDFRSWSSRMASQSSFSLLLSKMVYKYLCIIGHVYNDQKTRELITEILNDFLDEEI